MMRHFFPLDDLWEVTGRSCPCFTSTSAFQENPVWLSDGRRSHLGASLVRAEQWEKGDFPPSSPAPLQNALL